MEILNHNFVIKSCQENGTFSGYASVFDITDYHNDVVVRGAFCKSLKQWSQSNTMPKMLWQHDCKIPIGVWQEIKEDAFGLNVKGQLLLDIQYGKEAYILMQKGVIDGLSIGFQLQKSIICPHKGHRLLQIIDLQEISLVTFAANPLAKVMSLKERKGRGVVQQLQKLSNLIKHI